MEYFIHKFDAIFVLKKEYCKKKLKSIQKKLLSTDTVEKFQIAHVTTMFSW